jgi:enoyl-CoA hydratase/carnithine racemase
MENVLMDHRAIFAIYSSGALTKEAAIPDRLDENAFILAAHLEGDISLDLISRLSSIPLLYASSETIFSFAGARSLLEQGGESGVTELITRIGPAAALELILTEAAVDALRALRAGLINDLCSGAEFEERMEKISLLSLSAIRLAVDLARRAPRLGSIQAETLERYLFALRFSHPDQQEGMQAFLEKRQPKF